MRRAIQKLTDREKQVLSALVDLYVKTAEPVGSRMLTNKYKLGVSPATVRNTLQDLEEMGLLTQPHTSAGRVPTDLGYRVFVDHLLKREDLSQGEQTLIKQQLVAGYTAIDQILEQTCRILAEVSSQLSISTAPQFEKAVFARMEMIPVAERKLLVVLALKSGLIKSILMEVDSDLSITMVSEASRLLNERLAGLSLGEIRSTISDRFMDVHLGDPKLLKVFTDSVAALSNESDRERIHIGGTSNIAKQPEFQDSARLNRLLGAIEERRPFAEMVSSAALADGVVVTIGKEANLGQFEMCSMVTSTYTAGSSVGRIGVIGPTRMKYSKLVSIVDYTAKLLSDLFKE
jgi:heat-inducible transcriptional repressor